MMYLVEAEWISYDKTSGYNGTIAEVIDVSKSITDLSVSRWVIDADSEQDATTLVSRFHPWENSPTRVVATKIDKSIMIPNALYLGYENYPYWQNAAAALRAIPSEKRSAVSRENGKKGGRPRKQVE